MTVTDLNATRTERHIARLLERLDPTPSVCTVPGCTHIHDVADTPPTLAVA